MMRYLLPVILIAVPLISYIIWYRLAREKARRLEEGTLPGWREAPWGLIVLGTLGLVIICLAVFGFVGPDPAGDYVPARLEDGEVIPGYVTD